MSGQKQLNILNKRARYEYNLLQNYMAGIVLTGTEVKSVRENNVNISDAYCFFKDEELYIKGMNIGTWKQASFNNHELLRLRKLLLRKGELKKLRTRAAEKGLSIVPLKVFLSETGFVKLEIAVGQGKKDFDKRESIKERDVERNLRRDTD